MMGGLFSGNIVMVDLWYLADQPQERRVLAIPVGPRACLLHDYPTKKESIEV